MKKLLTLTLLVGFLSPVMAETGTAAKATAAEKAKKAAEAAKKTAEKAKETAKPAAGELSDSDKALLADAKKEAATLTPAQKEKLMDLLNKGDDKALQAVEGIGEERAKNIIAKRPFKNPEDAAMVDGIGLGTFKNLVASVKPAAKTAKSEAKPDAKAEKPAKPEAKPETKPAAKPEKPASAPKNK